MAVKKAKEAKQFLDGWVEAGQRLIDDKVEVWREVMANVLVEPYVDERGRASQPYGNPRDRDIRGMVLKDPESSQIAETFRNHMMGALFSDAEGKYIRAEPVGYEDSRKAKTVTQLLRYDFALPGVRRTLSEAMLDLAMFGTVVLETPWRYEEREVVVRTVTEVSGRVFDETSSDTIVTFDDPELNQVDLIDWYPDPDETRIEKMRGAAKGFTITPNRARELADDDDDDALYDKEAVEKAISKARSAFHERSEQKKRDVRHRKDNSAASFSEDFDTMKGYEYWGYVPFDAGKGGNRRVITMINGVVVRNDEWPLTDPDLPFHVLVINPVKGRHYGKAPAEVVRYTQDFADAMLMLIAEATIRQVHPPMAIDLTKDVDPAAVEAWHPDAVISVDGDTNGAVQTVQYASNIFQGVNFQQQLKTQMQQGSGALAAVQGQGLGINRASATEAAQTFQKAMTPIEGCVQLLEMDGLPQIGRGFLRRNQQFLQTKEDLKARCGELPEPTWIGDIMGDFDIQFVGTRNAVNRQMKMQAYDRLIALAQVLPQIATETPWDMVLADLFGDVLQLPEIAAIFASKDTEAARRQIAAKNLMMQMMANQAGVSGQNPQRPQSPGMGTAQAAGAPVEGE